MPVVVYEPLKMAHVSAPITARNWLAMSSRVVISVPGGKILIDPPFTTDLETAARYPSVLILVPGKVMVSADSNGLAICVALMTVDVTLSNEGIWKSGGCHATELDGLRNLILYRIQTLPRSMLPEAVELAKRMLSWTKLIDPTVATPVSVPEEKVSYCGSRFN